MPLVMVTIEMANAQLDIKFLPTARDGRYLCLGGYMFRVNKKVDDLIIWRCTTKNCTSSVSTVNDIPTRVGHNHCHPPIHDCASHLLNLCK